MPRRACLLGVVLLLALVPASAVIGEANPALENELRSLGPMNKGKDTPLDQVDRLADRLLTKYPGAEDRARIYCHIALVYIRSGTPYPKFIQKYSKRALDLPAEPLGRLRRYREYADSLFVIEGTKLPSGGYSEMTLVGPRDEWRVRPLAAVLTLEGLRDAKTCDIPKDRPEVPRRVGVRILGNDPLDPIAIQLRKEAAEINAASDRGMALLALWEGRQGLADWTVRMYSSPPYAATELRKLATAILEDPAAVEALMKQLEAKGALKDDPPDKK